MLHIIQQHKKEITLLTNSYSVKIFYIEFSSDFPDVKKGEMGFRRMLNLLFLIGKLTYVKKIIKLITIVAVFLC